MTPTFRDALQSGKPLIGTLLTVASPEVAEALALLGFDWIFIDLEHGSLSIKDAQTAIQAVAERSFTLVRVPDGTPENIKRVMDTGCTGIIVPMVSSESYARKIVALAKYPPLGERSVGLGRAHGYGLRFTEYLASANDRDGGGCSDRTSRRRRQRRPDSGGTGDRCRFHWPVRSFQQHGVGGSGRSCGCSGRHRQSSNSVRRNQYSHGDLL